MAPTLLVFILATLESFPRKNKLLNGRGLFGGNVFKNPARGIYFPFNRSSIIIIINNMFASQIG